MTVLTAYAPSYAPWKGLFHRIAQADLFVLTDTERLTPKSEHVRNTIIGPNGPIVLTVPVLGGRDQRLCDVRIDNSKLWRKKHAASIEHAYHASPFWDDYGEFFLKAYDPNWVYLDDATGHTMALLMEAYGTLPTCKRASHMAVEGSGSDFILNLCKHFQADTYLCGAAGRAYLNLPDFSKAGVEVEVQEWKGPRVSALHDLFTEGPVL